ncbi:RidA family protein [bacterium]|jgi:enamine deaminase RidA (YjgF/YER057c/UK114 family)|nr:RidA family protein [bacterium]MEC7840939.1 RidA family protein [Actinomycetota bacterium]MEC8329449.1 RidA family protein [Actinomycetota bacterium]MED5382848.1 RidA family protein [Actinomycetota bacterium]|tara:strand:- start:27 stop:446 length:420 start_codon:yes stop_codon:yes gene_type:complete
MNDKLPEAPKAAGNYVTVKKIGDFIYTSGHVPITDEKKIIGKIPNEISIEEGYDAASLCAELTIASLLTISDIKKLIPVNVLGFVNSSSDFTDQPKVLNGFTDKLDEFFSEKPTRSAVGVSSLPLNVCVEVQSVFYINE